MRPVAISAILLGVAHVTLTGPAAGAVPRLVEAAGAPIDGGAGATLVRAGATPFLAMPETRQSALLPVGEGGEGGRGRGRGRGRGGYYYGYGWAPPPAYFYAPRPPPRRVYRPSPPVYYAPPPIYYVPPPAYYYAPAPGVSLHFRF